MPILLSAVAAVVVAVLVAAPAVAIASAAPTATTQSGTWSFGNVSIVGFHGSDRQGQFSGTASYGFVTNVTSTNVTSTNTSAPTIEVMVVETIGISLTLQYCRPNCNTPAQVSQFDYAAWQTQYAWTNITTVANVTETLGNSVTTVSTNALGILNSSSRVRGEINESVNDTGRTAYNQTAVSSLLASYSYESTSAVAFSPALGILPTTEVSAGDSWASLASFQASAQWGAQWTLALTTPRTGTQYLNGSYTLSPSGSGLITLIGIAGSSGLRFNSARLLSIDYTLSDYRLALGPGFSVAWATPGAFGEGLPNSTPWGSHAGVRASAEFASMDALPTPGLAERLRSSAVDYSLAFLDPNNGDGVNDTAPSSQVSGAPMSSGQAGTTASCLQSGGVCSTVNPYGGSGALGATGTELLIVASVVVLSVLVLAVVVARQRRIPPPPYPNAALYPPGQPLPGPGDVPPEPPTPRGPPAGPADDPLDQLW